MPASKNRNTTFYNSWIATLIIPPLTLVSGAFGLWLILLQGEKYPNHPAITFTAAILFSLAYLWKTEALWFPLTTRRFAENQPNTLILYGAFGRKRFIANKKNLQLYHSDTLAERLIIEYPDGQLRTFILTHCAEPHALLKALHIHNRRHKKPQTAAQIRINECLVLLYKSYFVIIRLIVIIGTVQLIFRTFWSLKLHTITWQWGIPLGILNTLLLMIPVSIQMKRGQKLNRTANFSLRKRSHKNTNTRDNLKFMAVLLFLPIGLTGFFSYNIGAISLINTVPAEITANVSFSGETYNYGIRTTDLRKKLHVTLPPPPYQHFNGTWCSQYGMESPWHGTQQITLRLRESRFAQELEFP